MKGHSILRAAVAAVLLCGAAGARAQYVQGEINGWAASIGMVTNGAFLGDVHYSVTLTGTGTRPVSEFQFTQHSSSWDPQWGTGTSSTNATVNSTIGGSHGDLDGSLPGNLVFSEMLGMKYTFRLQGDASWWYRPFVIMATTNSPVSISSVSDNSATAVTNIVTVTAGLSAAPGGETVYVRYTTNDFANDSLVAASVAGTTATMQIPAMPSGRTVTYYVLTSTMPLSLVTSDTDLCTLRANNAGGGTNYSYVVGTPEPVMGNCWHFPANEEPVGATMRNPTNPTPSQDTYVYVGNYHEAGVGGADMTGGWVLYRKSTDPLWSSNHLSWDSLSGNNAYWKAAIPSSAVTLGETLQYILQVDYANGGADTTFLGTTNQTGQVQYAQATNAAAHPFEAVSMAMLGECWHNPLETVQGTSVTMRNPTNPRASQRTVVYAGNYQADIGGANMTNGVVWYRLGPGGAWSSTNMAFNNEVRNIEETGTVKNWIVGLPTEGFAEGEELQYVVAAEYDNRDTTFMGTTNQTDTVKVESLAGAQSNPYSVLFSAAPPPAFGNCWHFPTNLEPGTVTMRNPTNPTPGKDTYVYAGNYYEAGVGGADMTGGWVLYKMSAAGTWSSNDLTWDSDSGNNAYWKTSIPSNAVALGETLQYYLQVDYANGGADTTYLGTTNQTGQVQYAQATNAAAHPFEAASVADLGNCWHIPTNAEPAGAYMRNPRHPYADSDVTIYNGNQFAGTGTIGNQSGGTLYYRLQGPGAWYTAAMEYDTAAGDNKYWRGAIPANTYNKTQTLEYVMRVDYTDRDPTYLGLSTNSVSSETFETLAAAQAQPFDFTYGGDPGTEPGYVWHGGNAVKLSGDSLQIWVKIGYKNDTNQWADNAEVRYKVAAASPGSRSKQGVRSLPGRHAADPTLTNAVAMTYSHDEEDSSENGNAMWWVATITDTNLSASADAVLRYQVAAWKSAGSGGNGVERLAEYQADGINDQVFEYRMQGDGANALTVNGVNADYTTTKFFIDEAQSETAHVKAVYIPPVSVTEIQIFSNVGRRDYWDADLDGNGVPDAIRPPSGDLITTGTAGYYAAHDMTWSAADGGYVWEADIGECGAYRLTARYKVSGDTNWVYYSETGSGIRDHAVVISPRKVLEQSIYELNALSTKAAAPTEAGRSTFENLIDTSAPNRDTFNEFGIEYLNKIQANCLWFQPIHTSSEYGLDPGGEPGSPYSAKDYFSVSKWFGSDTTTADAMSEFQQFVTACDAGKSSYMSTSYVGTINIMLDGVFNHTSWDAVFGEMGEDMGLVSAGQGATTAIGSLRPGWYANVSDYGAPATFYNGPDGGQHDIASAPDRGDFGKWLDTAELFFGNYAALVRHNPDDNGNHLNEGDWYDYTSMTAHTEELWEYMGAYPEFWLEKTGHSLSNRPGQLDANGVLYDDYGIDGLRCDFAQGLPPQFWEYVINRTRATKWNFMFMAESLDGGVVSYRSNRHFDILNESFVFEMVGAGSPDAVKNAVESRKSIYSDGAVLLNLTSHDEVMPYSDPWVTASRFAMVSSMMGLPMTFYGQEQGIVPCTVDKSGKYNGDTVDGDKYNGFSRFELNVGKWVPHFKQWNKLLVWDDPPDAGWSRQMAQWYGQVNWARLNSPALQSGNQYYLGRLNEGTYDNGKIFAVAKYEESGAVAAGQDAVLAFSLFVNEGVDGHDGAADTYDLSPCWDLLGLSNSASVYYQVRNLASSDASAEVWPSPRTGADLYSNGVWVGFDSDDTGNIYDDGHIVQYLKIEEAAAPGAETTNSPVPVPYAWLDGYYGGGHSPAEYEALALQDASNGAMAVWQVYVADLDPTDEDAVFEVEEISTRSGTMISVLAASNRAYRIEFAVESLTAAPQTWNAFQANGTWTNLEPFTNRHWFMDTGEATNSGLPIGIQRNYRIWVELP